jgi:regulator of sigma E protease
LAAAETPLRGFRVASRFEGEGRQREYERTLPAPPPRLGISWNPTPSTDPVGLTVQLVRRGSAADRAGLRPGDTLVSLDGQPLTGSEVLQQAVVTAEQLNLGVQRSGADGTETLAVRLDGTPARLGFSWRHSDAEPNTVTVVRVLRHSPADRAGIQVGDRIHELAGQIADGSAAFQQFAGQVPLPAVVRIERTGQIRELSLPGPSISVAQ